MTTNNVNINFNDPEFQKALADYSEWLGSYMKDITSEFYKVSTGKIDSQDGSHGVDLNTGSFWYSVEPTLDSEVEYEETEFETYNGCEYSIFEDDEIEDAYHIEIDPDWTWNKDDVWDLIQKLLYTIGEIDEDNKLVGEGPEKQLFIITTPGSISKETGDLIGLHAKEALEKANIDAVPLILSDGLKAWFEKPRT